MKQKIICYDESGYASDNRTEFKELLDDGWRVVQISAVDDRTCWVLLEIE